MSDSAINTAMLLPHQKDLVDRVLGDGEVRRFYLVAPPGMGKSVALMSLADETLRRDPSKRVLFVGPARVLVDQFLEGVPSAGRATKIDAYLVREMADRGESNALFASSGLFACTLQSALSPQVRASLRAARWDLLLCDEVERISDDSVTAVLLADLLAASDGAVIVGAPSLGEIGREDVQVVRWDKSAVVDVDGKSFGPPNLRTVDLSYPVSPSFYDALRQSRTAGLALDTSEGTFEEALESSPAAAEMIALEHEAKAQDRETQELGQLAALALREIETLQSDAKLNALLAYVTGLERGRRICVATRFIQTAYYLSSALLEIAPVELVVASRDIAKTVSSGNASILVGSLQSLFFYGDLASVDHLIFYDSADSPAALRLIETANAVGRSKPLTVAMLRPLPQGA